MRKWPRAAFLLASFCLAFFALVATPVQDAAYRLVISKSLGANLHAVSWSLVPFVDTHQKIVERSARLKQKD